MTTKNLILVLMATVLLAASFGSMAQDGTNASSAGLIIPKDNLPEGFKLLASLPENDPHVNMTSYIKDFSGSQEIVPAAIVVGIYQWGKPGEAFDSKITLIKLQNDEDAKAAVSNYKSRSEYQNLLARGIPIFGNATINGHPTLEIKDLKDNGMIKRYLYLWNRGNVTVLVEGNADQNKSRDLARATGL